MLGFFKSKEFWAASSLLAAAFILQFAGYLANIIQDCGLYGWAYVIWKQEKNHTFVKSLFEDEE